MKIGYLLGLCGMWLACDGYISIIVCIRWLNNGNSWKYDHSIRLIRIAIGILLMVIGAIL